MTAEPKLPFLFLYATPLKIGGQGPDSTDEAARRERIDTRRTDVARETTDDE